MTITSYGYDGTLSEVAWATLASNMGNAFRTVRDVNDFLVELVAGSTTRAITVRTGTSSAFGVVDVNNSLATLNAAAVSSGTRWDTVVIRRNWSGTGGTTTLVIVQGTSTKAIAGGLNNNPGVIDDHPLALIRIVSSSGAVQEVQDLRAWPSDGIIFADIDSMLSVPAYGVHQGTVATILYPSVSPYVRTYVYTGTTWQSMTDHLADLQIWSEVPSCGTVAPGWSVSRANAVRYGGAVTVSLMLHRTGGTITPSGSNVNPDVSLFTLDANWRPLWDMNCAVGSGISVGEASVSAAGAVVLRSITEAITSGQDLTLTITHVIDPRAMV